MLGSHGRSWSGMLVLSPVRCSYLGKEGGGVRPEVFGSDPQHKKSLSEAKIFISLGIPYRNQKTQVGQTVLETSCARVC